jgi:hypothetical protein
VAAAGVMNSDDGEGEPHLPGFNVAVADVFSR